MKVYILMYVNNEYNQPNKAFSALFWDKPSRIELSAVTNTGINGSTKEFFDELLNMNKVYTEDNTEYWLEEFKK